MKRAYLVEVSIMTRVVVECRGDKIDEEAEASRLAIGKISANPLDYLCEDNVAEIREDFECPYGTLE